MNPRSSPAPTSGAQPDQRLEDRTEARDYFGHRHVTTVVPPRWWPILDLRELWAYRELLRVLALRDIKIRYKQTVLGVAWALLQPFVTMLVFTLVFGRMAKVPSDGYPYPIFVYAGLLPWTFFAGSVNAGANSLLSSSQLVTKVYFPRLLIPVASIGSALLDFAIASTILIAMMIYYEVDLTARLLIGPLIMSGALMTVVGVSAWLAALIVAYRDFRFVTPFMIQIWLFLTPVIYPTSIVPPDWQWLVRLNPMAGFVEAFRAAFLGTPFDWHSLGIAFLIAAVALTLGLTYFGRVERRFADII